MLEISVALVIVSAFAWDFGRRLIATKHQTLKDLEKRLDRIEQGQLELEKDGTDKFEAAETRIKYLETAVRRLTPEPAPRKGF